MATLLPILQFFDRNGKPLSNGKIYFYTTGTSSLKSIYTDQGQGTPLENPVLLNSAGRPQTSGSIWLNGQYSIVIEDSEGSLAYHTVDEFSAFNPVDWTTLTATISQINSFNFSTVASGIVGPSSAILVDSNKNIINFGSLSSVSLSSSSSVQTPLIKDSNGLSSVYISSVGSQVNSVKLTPSITAGSPVISALGSDTDIGLSIKGQGTGSATISNISYPSSDASAGGYILTNGSGSATLTEPYKVLGVAYSVNNTLVDGVNNDFNANTQYSEYFFNLSANVLGSITVNPVSASSQIVISVEARLVATTASYNTVISLFETTGSPSLTLNYPIAESYRLPSATNFQATMSLKHVLNSTGKTARTFKVYVTSRYSNAITTTQLFTTAVQMSSVTAMEV